MPPPPPPQPANGNLERISFQPPKEYIKSSNVSLPKSTSMNIQHVGSAESEDPTVQEQDIADVPNHPIRARVVVKSTSNRGLGGAKDSKGLLKEIMLKSASRNELKDSQNSNSIDRTAAAKPRSSESPISNDIPKKSATHRQLPKSLSESQGFVTGASPKFATHKPLPKSVSSTPGAELDSPKYKTFKNTHAVVPEIQKSGSNRALASTQPTHDRAKLIPKSSSFMNAQAAISQQLGKSSSQAFQITNNDTVDDKEVPKPVVKSSTFSNARDVLEQQQLSYHPSGAPHFNHDEGGAATSDKNSFNKARKAIQDQFALPPNFTAPDTVITIQNEEFKDLDKEFSRLNRILSGEQVTMTLTAPTETPTPNEIQPPGLYETERRQSRDDGVQKSSQIKKDEMLRSTDFLRSFESMDAFPNRPDGGKRNENDNSSQNLLTTSAFVNSLSDPCKKPVKLRRKKRTTFQGYETGGFERKFWKFVVACTTILIPDCCLVCFIKEKGMNRYLPQFNYCTNQIERRQSWREKITLFVLFFYIWCAFIFFIEVAPRYICYTFEGISIDKVRESTNLVVSNGQVFNLDNVPNILGIKTGDPPDITAKLRPFVGKDVSGIFPRISLLGHPSGFPAGYSDEILNTCVSPVPADEWLFNILSYQHRSPVVVNGKLDRCPIPDTSFLNQTTNCFYDYQSRLQLKQLYYSDLTQYPDVIKKDYKKPSDFWKSEQVIINSKVYDFTSYLQYAIMRTYDDFEKGLGTIVVNKDSMFLPESITLMVSENIGKDISVQFNLLPNSEMYQRCFDRLFFAGSVASTELAPLCRNGNPMLMAMSYFVFAILLIKYFSSILALCKTRKHPFLDRYVVLFVPCYTEGEKSLKDGIQRLASTEYSDKHKLLWITCDGMLTGHGNTKSTPQLVLDILGYSSGEVPSVCYPSLGEGSKKVNRAKVYVGFYSLQYHKSP